MSEIRAILDFAPAPKLGWDGRLDPEQAGELRGQQLFRGKARCVEYHAPPHYTDNTMHDLKLERLYEPTMVNGRFTTAGGLIKFLPLRGIKDSPPYLHDGRLLTLEDTVESATWSGVPALTKTEKEDLVVFMKTL